ncbi:HAD family hydrolase [Candidatus Parcubacteria bacterium]|nr:MAG: HAD family hydrolase [Candidatus Parcubacteria bacterium]
MNTNRQIPASDSSRSISNGVKHLQAIMFDADGTVLDTRELVFAAFEHVMTGHGYAMPPIAEIAKFGGRPTEETYAHFAKNHNNIELRNKHREFQETHLELFDAYEGFDDMVAVLKQAGLKVGMCTNRASNVITLLEHLGMHEHFDAVVHADMVSSFKPDPEGFLKLCKELDVEPSASVMVGDTEADIGAGKVAGAAFTIGLTHGLGTRELLESEGADYVVDHLSEILPIILKH